MERIDARVGNAVLGEAPTHVFERDGRKTLLPYVLGHVASNAVQKTHRWVLVRSERVALHDGADRLASCQ